MKRFRLFRDSVVEAGTGEPLWEGYSLLIWVGDELWVDMCDHWWQIPKMLAEAVYFLWIKKDED